MSLLVKIGRHGLSSVKSRPRRTPRGGTTRGLRTASISHFVGFSGYGCLNSTNARAANNVGTAAHTVCRGA